MDSIFAAAKMMQTNLHHTRVLLQKYSLALFRYVSGS